MNDTISIKRYRLSYGGTGESDVRRWTLRPVEERRGNQAVRRQACAQPRDAMYATPLRTYA
jgi:hypothetical protein